MFPTLFHANGIAVHSYGFFIALGYLAALAITIFAARLEKIRASHFVDMVFFSLLSGLVGARALFVLTNLSYFKNSPQEIFSVWQGGLVFFGGLITSLPVLLLYIKKNGLPLYKCLDILSLGLIVGHAFGRIGCLGAGCCHGNICELPWAITISSEMVAPSLRNIPIHPTQAYEAAALFILFGVLWRIWRRRGFDGQVAFLYLMLYSVVRSVIEVFRGDSIRGFLVPNLISTSQAISILVFIAALFLYLRRKQSLPTL